LGCGCGSWSGGLRLRPQEKTPFHIHPFNSSPFSFEFHSSVSFLRAHTDYPLFFSKGGPRIRSGAVVHFLNFFCRPGNSLSLRAFLHSLEEKELTFLGPSSAGAGSDSNSAKKAAMQKTKKKKFQKWNRPRFKRDKPQTNILFGDLLSRHFTTLIFFGLKTKS